MGASGALYALEARTEEQRWRVLVAEGEPTRVAAAPIVVDGVVFTGASSTMVSSMAGAGTTGCLPGISCYTRAEEIPLQPPMPSELG